MFKLKQQINCSTTSIVLFFISWLLYYCSLSLFPMVLNSAGNVERENLCSIELRTFQVCVHTDTIRACGVPADAHTDSGLYGLERPGINH